LKSARRRSREFATQALYQWQLNAMDPTLIADDIAQTKGFEQADEAHFRGVFHGVVGHVAELRARIQRFRIAW
jgi:transcription antitermination protein NusB